MLHSLRTNYPKSRANWSHE